MPLDPGRWPETLPDGQFWAAQLRTAAQAWAEEARRLRVAVRAPTFSGPCAHALWACADLVAAEIDRLAAQIDGAAGQRPSAPGHPS